MDLAFTNGTASNPAYSNHGSVYLLNDTQTQVRSEEPTSAMLITSDGIHATANQKTS